MAANLFHFEEVDQVRLLANIEMPHAIKLSSQACKEENKSVKNVMLSNCTILERMRILTVNRLVGADQILRQREEGVNVTEDEQHGYHYPVHSHLRSNIG